LTSNHVSYPVVINVKVLLLFILNNNILQSKVLKKDNEFAAPNFDEHIIIFGTEIGRTLNKIFCESIDWDKTFNFRVQQWKSNKILLVTLTLSAFDINLHHDFSFVWATLCDTVVLLYFCCILKYFCNWLGS
jgi:hypothetical protein